MKLMHALLTIAATSVEGQQYVRVSSSKINGDALEDSRQRTTGLTTKDMRRLRKRSWSDDDYIKERNVLDGLYDSFGGNGWYQMEEQDHCRWSKVTCSGGMITGLYFSHVGAQGTIPGEIMHLKNLESCWLAENQLTGTVPVEIGTLPHLERLYLASNKLTGTIPVEIGHLQPLEWLDLSSNQLTGTIPVEIGHLENLVWLKLSKNQLTGNIPAEIGNLQYLARLNLSYNQLTGTIPVEIRNLPQNLEYFNLDGNQFS